MTDQHDDADCYGTRDVFETPPFSTARELWDALDITRESWTAEDEARCPWLFRGMRRGGDELLPPAWHREGHEHDLIANSKEAVARDYDYTEWLGGVSAQNRPWQLQRAAECRLIHDFIEHATASGLTLPPDTPTERSKTSPGPDHEVVALAQHHGVPTQLLDFTRDPYVAMFWACQEPHKPDEYLAIWALRRYAVKPGDWEMREHSRARNRNLFAQDGAAIEMTQGDQALLADRPLPALETCSCVRNGTLRKLTLPRAHVPALRRLLTLRGVTLAKLMPGYDGVAATVRASYR